MQPHALIHFISRDAAPQDRHCLRTVDAMSNHLPQLLPHRTHSSFGSSSPFAGSFGVAPATKYIPNVAAVLSETGLFGLDCAMSDLFEAKMS